MHWLVIWDLISVFRQIDKRKLIVLTALEQTRRQRRVFLVIILFVGVFKHFALLIFPVCFNLQY